MKTKIIILLLVIVTLFASACSGPSGTPTTPLPTQAPLESVTTPTQIPPDAVAIPTIVFSLDPTLGSGYEIMTIAENSDPAMGYFEIHPEHIEITIQDYAFANSTISPRIYLFAVDRFSQLLPDLLPSRLADLKMVLSGGVVSSDELPLLPVFNSHQMFSSHQKVIEFQNGKGIRYITQYSQGIVPINNQGLFYTFQGLTNDGKYWVAVLLPVSDPILPADGANPPDGQSMEDFSANYLSHVADTTARLNAEIPGSFTPNLILLDILVNSITVTH